jgi:hypothetical protein
MKRSDAVRVPVIRIERDRAQHGHARWPQSAIGLIGARHELNNSSAGNIE